jgi:hypothetical protein
MYGSGSQGKEARRGQVFCLAAAQDPRLKACVTARLKTGAPDESASREAAEHHGRLPRLALSSRIVVSWRMQLGCVKSGGGSVPTNTRAYQGSPRRLPGGSRQHSSVVQSCHLDAAGGLLMVTSTRRFCCRPAAESLSATGSFRPLLWRLKSWQRPVRPRRATDRQSAPPPPFSSL